MRLLDDPAEVAHRRAMLAASHMRKLAAYAQALRRETGRHVPDIDPCDGGTAAAVLLLLETPGPAIRSTGFVSRDNPTPTGRNIRRFASGAALARADTIIWNAVPWTIHSVGSLNRAPLAAEIRAGQALLPGFLALLPGLRCAILAGRVAGLARAIVERTCPGVTPIAVPHPSPTIVCTSSEIGARIRDGFARAAAILADGVA